MIIHNQPKFDYEFTMATINDFIKIGRGICSDCGHITEDLRYIRNHYGSPVCTAMCVSCLRNYLDTYDHPIKKKTIKKVNATDEKLSAIMNALGLDDQESKIKELEKKVHEITDERNYIQIVLSKEREMNDRLTKENEELKKTLKAIQDLIKI